jgi:acyl-[acyl-carrier-protein]-phospholipid O-acyltransferase/long-chain-fatty-acid--[acyl-carrier-protein] ligase
LHTITSSLRIARSEPFLLNAVVGSAFFLFIGAYAQLNMIPFSVHSLGFTDIQGGYVFLLTAVGIGTGSMIAGKISGKSAELALVPLGGLGITASLFIIFWFSTNPYVVFPAVTMLGLFGGIYMIPLDSYIQIMSPNQSRGQVVAATNFLSFFGVLCASMFIYVLTAVFELKPHEGFLIMGFLTLTVSLIFILQLFDHTTRFLCMILSRLHFNTQFVNQKVISDSPTIYICQHTAWNDTLLLMGSQRRRIRFFIEKEQEHTKVMKRLYHMLKIIFLPQLQPLKPAVINHYLEKGFSLCILTEASEAPDHLINLIRKTTDAPIVNVSIEKSAPPNPKPILSKFRVPATVTFNTSQ